MLETLKKFYKFVFNYKKLFFSSVFLIFISAYLKNLVPIEIGRMVDKVSNGNVNEAYTILVLLIVLISIRMLLEPVARQFSDFVAISISKNIWASVFEHLHRLDFAYHVNKSSGSLISLFKRGENGILSLYLNLNMNVLQVIVEFLLLFGFLSTLYPKVLFVAVTIFLLIILFIAYAVSKNVKIRNVANEHQDVVSAITVDNMMNFDTVKYFANESYEQSRLKKYLKSYKNAETDYTYSFRIIELGNGAIINFGLLAMILIALIDYGNGVITVGMFVTVVSFATIFSPRLFELVFNIRDVAKNFADAKRFLEVLDVKEIVKDKPKPSAVKAWKSFEGNTKFSIEFKDVNFGYDKGNEILKNFNLVIKPGESIALVGQSGAGKTTLIKLLMRLYDPSSGNIFINDVNIKDICKSELRKKIGIVPQETILFNDTIGYNIAYGKNEFSQGELDIAVKAANLQDFIYSLPDQYLTYVGERGIKLSGGQKQRLGIARVFMENAPIIIFDEATSNLDSESERLIQESFWNLANGRTTIIIAHRLSTVKKVDKIIVMDNGEIAEIGTHSELSKKDKGIYSYLWGLQSGERIEPDSF
ncbi:ABC transporter ATP-binding protein [Candidatus Dojkabacteria bacterium]|nr:ABC transporter ATP-binding protein [Candidatus Dojkabacteria bacterium]